MAAAARETVTRLLGRIAQAPPGSDEAAAQELLPLVYDELRVIAEAQFRQEKPGHTLQPTALVHEAFLKLVNQDGLPIEGRRHFFALAAKAMRQILVDHARAKARLKRGAGAPNLPLADDQPTPTELSIPDLVALDDALERLDQLDPRKARLVELRFFGGFNSEEAAEVLGVARSTAAEDWRFAKAWLRRELSGEPR